LQACVRILLDHFENRLLPLHSSFVYCLLPFALILPGFPLQLSETITASSLLQAPIQPLSDHSELSLNVRLPLLP
jgi:hypothetical protein